MHFGFGAEHGRRFAHPGFAHDRLGRPGWGQGEGGGRRRMFDGSELRLVVLKLIADQPRHGYDLIRAIEALTGGAYAPSPGVVYPSITMLQDMGHIAEIATDGARKAFTATDKGRAHLVEKASEVAAMMARLAGLAQVRGRTDSAPVRRAIGNLRAAIHDRLSRDDADAEISHRAAALLDDAAQKIERL